MMEIVIYVVGAIAVYVAIIVHLVLYPKVWGLFGTTDWPEALPLGLLFFGLALSWPALAFIATFTLPVWLALNFKERINKERADGG